MPRTDPGRASALAAALLALASAARPAPADRVEFARGGVANLPATVEGDRVRLDTPIGPFSFDRSDFRSIDRGRGPEPEWPARESEALAGDADARVAAAAWALERGLTDEARAMVAAAAEADPSHPDAARMADALETLARPCPDPDLGPIRRALGSHRAFREVRTAHVVLLHQHDEAEAHARAEALERVVTTFYLLFAAEGLELRPPARRLASAWIARREDYLAYLQRQGAHAFRTTRGYYHPGLGLVAVSDPRGDAWYRRALARIGARRQSPHDPADARDAERLFLLLEFERLAHDLGTAAHEVVHQLVAESGLEPRPGAFPHWLHEGLAAQFEVVESGRWAGVGRPNPLRARSLRPAPALAPLLADAGLGRGYAEAAYADAWSLTRFLRSGRPDAFRAFLGRLRAPDGTPGRDGVSRTRAAFRAAFGDDPAALEAAWHASIAADRREPLRPREPDRRPPVPGSGRAGR